ncbi:MAG: quinolone resistance protein [Firmicutes bacterium]|nr:quinolone resistance protein [Bacillota bacterium]
MSTTKLWTKNFIALIFSNALMFGGFHILLPTLPVYAASNGATGTEIGIITGIFGFSAIFIRLFTDLGVKIVGKKNCLYIGLLISLICTVSYAIFSSVEGMIITRVLHGFGFGLTTTFSAAIAADIIPGARRGEGIGYFGLGSTVAMAVGPAIGVWLISDYGFVSMFIVSALGTGVAIFGTKLCDVPNIVIGEKENERAVSLLDKFFERGTGIPSLLTMLFGVSYGSVNTFIAMLAQEANIENSGYFFIVGTLCVFLSRPIGGKIFDTKGAAWIILPGSVFLLLGLIVLIHTTTLGMLLGAAVLYGFGGGFLLPALITWMLNLVQPHRRSAASATFYNMLDVGTSAGAILLGMVAERVGFISMYKYSAGAMGIFLIVFALQTLMSKSIGEKEEELIESK